MQLDKDKLRNILSEMGYSVEFDSDTPGFCVGNKKYDWNSIIPAFLKNNKEFDTVYRSNSVKFISTSFSNKRFDPKPTTEYRYNKREIRNSTSSHSIYKVNITNKRLVKNFVLGKAV